MKTLLTSAALAALIVATPVLAQDATTPATPNATTTMPANPAPAPMKVNPAAPTTAPGAVTAPAPADTGNVAAPTAPMTTAQDQFIGDQATGEVLASNIIGATVYGPDGKDVGDVSDILVSQEGQVSGVVIGVGGFLGIGEKSIAVPFNAVMKTADENGKLKLSVNLTKDQLESAPDFMTLADKASKTGTPVAPAVTTPMAPTPAPAK
jgi:sporulation protein YlmC with PRC-barrel domain